jgi:molecular chaperone HtpG
MSEDELEANLGTIAKSGSRSFKEEMAAAEGADEKAESPIDIIGQFGVGFYSAFMVADEVTVISRKYGSDIAYKWSSTGADGYTITPFERAAAGTDVIIKIKHNAPDSESQEEDYDRFLEEYALAGLVKKYSDYIRYPIMMERTRSRRKEGTPDDKPEYESYTEIETLNSMVPIWQRGKSEVKEEDYNSFYHEKFFDYEDPLRVIHMDAEGLVSFKALLFVPAKAAYDYYTKDFKKGLQLYSSGVMIMENCADLLPEHFRFVRGVVDSPDLSLNISREMLQHDRQLKVIATNLEKKIKSELLKMQTADREKYEKFFKAFGLQLKYGVAGSFGANSETLADLLMFPSSYSDKPTTLAEYVTRMKPEQEHIYYAAGENAARIAHLPQTERIRDKGFEILYFTEEVDEFAAQAMRKYQEKDFISANSDDAALATEDEKKAAEKAAKDNKTLLEFIKETLGERVSKVIISQKLKSHPVVLTAEGGLSFEMEKYLSQVQPEMAPKAERVLELNPGHAIFASLSAAFESDRDKAAKYAEVLYNQALLMAGLQIEDPVAYSDLVLGLMG